MTQVQPSKQAPIDELQEFVQGKDSFGRCRRTVLTFLCVLAALTAQSMMTAGLVVAVIRADKFAGPHVGKTGVLEATSGKPVATAATVKEYRGTHLAAMSFEDLKSLQSTGLEHNGTYSVYHIGSVHRLDDRKTHIIALDGTKVVVGRDTVKVIKPDPNGAGRRLENCGEKCGKGYSFDYHDDQIWAWHLCRNNNCQK